MDIWATVAAYGGLGLGLLNLARDILRERRRSRERLLVKISQWKTLDSFGAPSEQAIGVHVTNRSDHAVVVDSMSLEAAGADQKLWMGPAPNRGRGFPRTLDSHGACWFYAYEADIRATNPTAYQGNRVRVIVFVSTGASFSSKWITVDWESGEVKATFI